MLVLTMSNNIDMAMVDSLRRHMAFTAADLASAVGVSRTTYHNWLAGKPIRDVNAERLRTVIRRMVAIAKSGEWDARVLDNLPKDQRRERVLALIDGHQ
jgi:AcrR family transcriptional regulator